MRIGVAIAFGPIVIFLFVSLFSSFFGSNTVLFWHYLSAFGLIVYLPVGLAIVAIGWIVCRRSRVHLRASQ